MLGKNLSRQYFVDTAQKPHRVFLGHVFFSVTETDETIKI